MTKKFQDIVDEINKAIGRGIDPMAAAANDYSKAVMTATEASMLMGQANMPTYGIQPQRTLYPTPNDDRLRQAQEEAKKLLAMAYLQMGSESFTCLECSKDFFPTVILGEDVNNHTLFIQAACHGREARMTITQQDMASARTAFPMPFDFFKNRLAAMRDLLVDNPFQAAERNAFPVVEQIKLKKSAAFEKTPWTKQRSR